jgi:hypothetical protein
MTLSAMNMQETTLTNNDACPASTNNGTNREMVQPSHRTPWRKKVA